jgi:hypothetical protein
VPGRDKLRDVGGSVLVELEASWGEAKCLLDTEGLKQVKAEGRATGLNTWGAKTADGSLCSEPVEGELGEKFNFLTWAHCVARGLPDMELESRNELPSLECC